MHFLKSFVAHAAQIGLVAVSTSASPMKNTAWPAPASPPPIPLTACAGLEAARGLERGKRRDRGQRHPLLADGAVLQVLGARQALAARLLLLGLHASLPEEAPRIGDHAAAQRVGLAIPHRRQPAQSTRRSIAARRLEPLLGLREGRDVSLAP